MAEHITLTGDHPAVFLALGMLTGIFSERGMGDAAVLTWKFTDNLIELRNPKEGLDEAIEDYLVRKQKG